jgi:hypothetical protein
MREDTYMSQGFTLTPKQAAFAGFIADGEGQISAYRKAYKAGKMSDASIRVEASKTALNERVQAHIKALRQDKATAVKSQEKVRKSWVLERLRDEALDLENPPSTRVRALELLGKSSGLFDDSTTVTIESRTPEQIELELQDKLAALFGNSKAKDN